MLKKLLLSVGIVIAIISCGSAAKTSNDTMYGTSMRATYINKATQYQVDSIIAVDTLPNLSTWIISSYRDYETGKPIVKRMYIRTIQGGKECTYIITGTEEPYKITKRIIE